ncbi:Arginine/ornithine antiporter [compost metagenome]
MLLFAFKGDMFALNFWGYVPMTDVVPDLAHLDDYGRVGHAALAIEPQQVESLFSQVRSTMLVTVFVFIGIEGASVYSRLAKNRKDVGAATVLGFIGVMCLMMLITMLSYGVLLRPDLAALRQPSMAGVLEAVVGRWGAIFISVGLIVSVLGAYLSWTLLAAEVLYLAAKENTMPRYLARENANQVPATAMWLTSGLIQVFLILTMFTRYAFTLALELTSSLALIPYLLVAAYGLKLAWTRETYDKNPEGMRADLIIAAIATFYTLLMVLAGGMKYLLLSAVIYAPGTILFYFARREQGKQVFLPFEKVLFIVTAIAAVVAVYSIATGLIVI